MALRPPPRNTEGLETGAESRRKEIEVSEPAPLRTLLADDSAIFTSGALSLLSARTDLTIVEIVRNGPAALEAFERLRPDLVLLDAVLPGLDGFRIARAIKSRPTPPFVAIVTFLASAETRREALAVGADAFLAKDEFAEGFDLLIVEAKDYQARLRERIRTPAKPAPLGSRTEPEP
jgi:CheY-like chemotaxis protein